MMANPPKRQCSQPGCYKIQRASRCDEHKGESRRQQDKRRGSAASRGYGPRWRKASKQFLKENPLCVECKEEGRLRPSIITDHIIPHRGDMELFWDEENNWQALCKGHHDRKTARGE